MPVDNKMSNYVPISEASNTAQGNVTNFELALKLHLDEVYVVMLRVVNPKRIQSMLKIDS